MFTSVTNRAKNSIQGFTLIELLVVIAIIGILSSVVLASLGTAREKARDATRISDMKNIQLALELYFDGSSSYPHNTVTAGTTNTTCTAAAAEVCDSLTTGTSIYIPNMPSDPLTGRAATLQYRYIGVTAAAGECNTAGACSSFRLGTPLERTDNPTLQKDQDLAAIGTLMVPLGDVSCAAAPGATPERCYSLAP